MLKKIKVLSIILLCILLAACNSNDASSSKNENTKLKSNNIGDVVNIDGLEITINNTKYTDDRNQFQENQPEEVLILDFYVENKTDEEIVFSASDFEIYDADGTKMDIYPLDSVVENLLPGKNASGQGTYGVSGKAPYEVYYTELLKGHKAKWILDVK